jgi:NCS1 family nucleobase:cation symporter-1
VWAALAAVVYLFVRVLGEPLPAVEEGGAASFWTGVDVVIALPVSWFPLAADYTRHSRDARSAFVGTAAGYGLSTIAMFTLGALALAAYGDVGLDVIDALLAVPLGLLAVLVLITVEVDEAFANVYSTAVSAQNVAARLDRRLLAALVGTVATVLALSLDVVAYEPFLFLLGSIFVPLAGVFVVAYWLLPRGAWDTSDDAPARPSVLVPWAVGFVSYQLTLPTFFFGVGAGWTAWWSERQADFGISATNGLSASIVSLTVASLLTVAVALPGALKARRQVASAGS